MIEGVVAHKISDGGIRGGETTTESAEHTWCTAQGGAETADQERRAPTQTDRQTDRQTSTHAMAHTIDINTYSHGLYQAAE